MVRKQNKKRKKEKSVEDFVAGILDGDRAVLAQAITLVESNAEKHFEQAQQVITQILPHVGKSIRIGISGVPGAGKSTFIEAIGQYICEQGHQVAVLAVDPSSSVTGGSILADKTRMEKLARDKRAFVRPSPSAGTLGGVTRKTRESILLCEAAGFDVILIETMGVGQSEIVVRSMVDLFILLVLTGAGDELQGIKKGVMELADLVLINKADGENKQKAETTKKDFTKILHYLKPYTPGWEVKALSISALQNEGTDSVWETIKQFIDHTKATSVFQQRRQDQVKDWISAMIIDQLQSRFFSHPDVKKRLPIAENNVTNGLQSVPSAVKELLDVYERNKK